MPIAVEKHGYIYFLITYNYATFYDKVMDRTAIKQLISKLIAHFGIYIYNACFRSSQESRFSTRKIKQNT